MNFLDSTCVLYYRTPLSGVTAKNLKQSNTSKGKFQGKNTVHGVEASVFPFNFLRIVLCQYVKLLDNILAGWTKEIYKLSHRGMCAF